MSALIIDGKAIALRIEADLKDRVKGSQERTGEVPGLVSIVVGDDKQSHKFVSLKGRAAERVGVNFEKKVYPSSFDPRLIVNFIHQKNADEGVHGIIVQLPLPAGFDRVQLLKAVHPYKDVDCLHPKNLGLLMMGEPVFVPPVVQAVVAMISCAGQKAQGDRLVKHLMLNKLDLKGKEVALVGAGLLVGRPLAVYLMNQGATVSIANERTKGLAKITATADIVVSATGVRNLITADHIKEGAVVVDAAMDVDLESVEGKAAVVSPSPGGVGPLTVVYLLANTVEAFRRAYDQRPQKL